MKTKSEHARKMIERLKAGEAVTTRQLSEWGCHRNLAGALRYTATKFPGQFFYVVTHESKQPVLYFVPDGATVPPGALPCE